METEDQHAWGIGCDIVKVEAFRGDHRSMYGKVFLPEEFEYCEAKAYPEQHLAARFAAKESVIKALGSLGKKVDNYHQIAIRRHEAIVEGLGPEFIIRISMSHTDETAMATAFIQSWK